MNREGMLEEIVRFSTPPQKEEDEFTVGDYRDCYRTLGWPLPARRTAKTRLEKLVEAGVLTKRLVLLSSRWTAVYRKVDGDAQT